MKEHAEETLPWDDKHDPEPSRQLWWLLVQLDTQLSFLLGRRPSIEPSQKFPRPEPQGTLHDKEGVDQDIIKFSEYMSQFLNHVHQDPNDRHSVWEDKRGMLHSELTRLLKIESDLPALPSSGAPDTIVGSMARHRIDVNLVLIVLYTQILRTSSPESTTSGRHRNLRKSTQKASYKALLKSLRATTDVFDYSYELDRANAASSWPRCFGVFCATSMLGIAGLQQQADMESDSNRIRRALRIFSDLAKEGQAPGIAKLATESLTKILDGIVEREQQASSSTEARPTESMNDVGFESQPPVRRANKPAPMIKTEVPSLKRSNTSNLEGDARSGKRVRSNAETTAYRDSLQTPSWQEHAYSQVMVFDASSAQSQEPISSQGLEQVFPTSASTSFNEQTDFYEAEYVPNHPNNFVDWHPAYGWVHPPERYEPPMYDGKLQAQLQPYENMTSGSNVQQSTYPELPLSVGQFQQLENAMQHQNFATMQRISPTHGQGMMTLSNPGVQTSGSTSTVAHPVGNEQQIQYYGAVRPHQGHAHARSSPVEVGLEMEGTLNRPAPDRRRSVADIRQQQMGLWIEQPSVYNERAQRSNQVVVTQGRRQSPSRLGMSSTAVERAPPVGHRMMQELVSQHGGSIPPCRTQSTAHLVGSGVPNIEQQHDWQALQQSRQFHYDIGARVPFDATMIEEGVMEYSEQLQYHQQQHHVPVVTTGPLAGDGQGHWRWTD